MNCCYHAVKPICKVKECQGESDWIFKDPVDIQGKYGSVWRVCCQNKCSYVAKTQTIASQTQPDCRSLSLDQIKTEVDYQTWLSRYQLAVPIVDTWMTTKTFTFVMPVLKATLGTILGLFTDKRSRMWILGKVITLIQNLHVLGVIHGDSHFNNIMINYDLDQKSNYTFDDLLKSNMKFYLIDFGLTRPLEGLDYQKSVQMMKRDFAILNTSLKSIISKTSNQKSILTMTQVLDGFM